MFRAADTQSVELRGLEARVTEQDEREQVIALLRQLWLGLSAYRLYPGSLDRPGFVAAVERIRGASERVLAAGPLDVEVHGERLFLHGEPLPDDQPIERLALACFERRAERLVVQSVPDAADLDGLFRTLSTPVGEMDEAGGADALLRDAGVSSVTLGRIGPDPVVGADHVPEELTAEPSPTGGGLPDPAGVSADLLLEDMGGSPADQAETILGRFRSIVDSVPQEVPRVDLYGRLHDVIADLPPELRRSLTEILVDRVRDDSLAARLIGTMSNAELTRALVDLGREHDRDPVQLARQLATAGVRHLDIVDLTKALEAGREEAGTILAGLDQLGIDLAAPFNHPGPGASISDVLGEYLLATQSDDLRAMEGLATAGDEQRRALALSVLRDYLVLETDLERVGEVLDLWVGEVRQALKAHEGRRVEGLVGIARDARASSDDRERVALFDGYSHQVLAGPFLTELVAAEAAEVGDEASPLPSLLAPFGEEAVTALLDVLADEEDRARRALLLGALRQVAPGHLGPVVERLSDARWYVVRNAVNILRSVGGEDVLENAAHHGNRAVRREATFGLVAAGGVKSIPHLQRLAGGPDPETREQAVSALGGLAAPEAVAALAAVVRSSRDPPVWRGAIDALGEHPAPEATVVLQELASRRTRPRLPRALRRHARARARQRRSAAA